MLLKTTVQQGLDLQCLKNRAVVTKGLKQQNTKKDMACRTTEEGSGFLYSKTFKTIVLSSPPQPPSNSIKLNTITQYIQGVGGGGRVVKTHLMTSIRENPLARGRETIVKTRVMTS